MKKYFGAAAALVLGFAAPAAAQDTPTSQAPSTDSPTGSRLGRPAPPGPVMSPSAAAASAKSRVEADKSAGRVPDHNTLKILLSAQSTLKDEPGVEATLEEEVTDYNDPADWVQAIDTVFMTPDLRDQDGIWLGRLMFVVDAPVSPDNANMVGAIASQLALFGDAVNAKAHGAAVSPDPGPRADSDKATIQQQITAEQAQDGTYNAKLAEALYSYGMYPQAEAAARLALQKGGNPDPSEAAMVLGQALVGQGKYDDAIASFGQITSAGQATQRIARLWADYAKIKKNPPSRR